MLYDFCLLQQSRGENKRKDIQSSSRFIAMGIGLLIKMK